MSDSTFAASAKIAPGPFPRPGGRERAAAARGTRSRRAARTGTRVT